MPSVLSKPKVDFKEDFSDFEKFKLQIETLINVTRNRLMLPISYRNQPMFIKYPGYLTPTLSKLPNDVITEIASSNFSLKPIDKIIENANKHGNNVCRDELLRIGYNDAFDFAKDGQQCHTLGNSKKEVNLLRCLYDLSVRYRKDPKLLDYCSALISGFIKYFYRDTTTIDISVISVMELVTDYFKINNNEIFWNKVLNAVKQRWYNLNEIELKMLNECAYIAPSFKKLDELIENFYTEYYNRAISKQIDLIDMAAWIIKTFCDIHPFVDGNGKVARTIAFKFITSKTGIIFEDREIDVMGEEPEYIKATSRINQFPEKFELLKQWVNQIVEIKEKIQNERKYILWKADMQNQNKDGCVPPVNSYVNEKGITVVGSRSILCC